MLYNYQVSTYFLSKIIHGQGEADYILKVFWASRVNRERKKWIISALQHHPVGLSEVRQVQDKAQWGRLLRRSITPPVSTGQLGLQSLSCLLFIPWQKWGEQGHPRHREVVYDKQRDSQWVGLDKAEAGASSGFTTWVTGAQGLGP